MIAEAGNSAPGKKDGESEKQNRTDDRRLNGGRWRGGLQRAETFEKSCPPDLNILSECTAKRLN